MCGLEYLLFETFWRAAVFPSYYLLIKVELQSIFSVPQYIPLLQTLN